MACVRTRERQRVVNASVQIQEISFEPFIVHLRLGRQ